MSTVGLDQGGQSCGPFGPASIVSLGTIDKLIAFPLDYDRLDAGVLPLTPLEEACTVDFGEMEE